MESTMRSSTHAPFRSPPAPAILMFAGAATAQSSDPAASGMQPSDADASSAGQGDFDVPDSDHNGHVSRSEASADSKVPAEFDARDGDKNQETPQP